MFILNFLTYQTPMHPTTTHHPSPNVHRFLFNTGKHIFLQSVTSRDDHRELILHQTNIWTLLASLILK
jgi:hypothetical protein